MKGIDVKSPRIATSLTPGRSSRWLPLGLPLAFGACLLASSALGGEPAAPTSEGKANADADTARHSEDEASKAQPKAPSGIAEADFKRLQQWLASVGAGDAPVKLMARSPERQARIMYTLAAEDVDAAREMYCDAGDAVINRFDPSKSRDTNIATMQQELIAQLPEARNIGCLDHIENDDVYAVDVDAEAVPSDRHAELVATSKRAVAAGELHAFRHPPSHRGAFHFEFNRNPSPAASGEQAPADQTPKASPPSNGKAPPNDGQKKGSSGPKQGDTPTKGAQSPK